MQGPGQPFQGITSTDHILFPPQPNHCHPVSNTHHNLSQPLQQGNMQPWASTNGNDVHGKSSWPCADQYQPPMQPGPAIPIQGWHHPICHPHTIGSCSAAQPPQPPTAQIPALSGSLLRGVPGTTATGSLLDDIEYMSQLFASQLSGVGAPTHEEMNQPILSETGRELIITECALADGSHYVCDMCGGVVPYARSRQHQQYWCAGKGDHDDEGGSEEEEEGAGNRKAVTSPLSTGVDNARSPNAMSP